MAVEKIRRLEDVKGMEVDTPVNVTALSDANHRDIVVSNNGVFVGESDDGKNIFVIERSNIGRILVKFSYCSKESYSATRVGRDLSCATDHDLVCTGYGCISDDDAKKYNDIFKKNSMEVRE